MFWQYLSIRVILDVLRASSLMLFEGAVVVIIKEQVNSIAYKIYKNSLSLYYIYVVIGLLEYLY